MGFVSVKPWNARSIAEKVGFTAITTQQIWRDHRRKSVPSPLNSQIVILKRQSHSQSAA